MLQDTHFKSASIKLTRKDASSVFNSISLRRWQSKLVLVVFYFIVVSYLFFIKDSRSIENVWLPVLGGLVFLLLFVCIVDYLIIYFHTKKLIKSPLFTTEVKVFSNENGFISESERGKQELRWSDFQKYCELEKHIYLKTHEGIFLIFPKRSFDDENLSNFIKLAQENVKK